MKNFHFLVLLASSFLFLTSFGKPDCPSFRTGKYVVYSKVYTTHIERFEQYQTEYTPSNGLKLKSKITWETDCDYYISDYEVLENPKKIDVSFIEDGSNVYFEIVKTKKKYVKTIVRVEKNGAPLMKMKYHRK